MAFVAALPAIQIAAMATAAAGTAIAAYGQYSAARHQENIANYNASLAKQAAKDARMRGEADETRYRMKIGQFIGKQTALIGASGAVGGGGSPLRLTTDTAGMGELDALSIKVGAQRQAWAYEGQAGGFSMESDLFASAKFIAPTATIAGGASQQITMGREPWFPKK